MKEGRVTSLPVITHRKSTLSLYLLPVPLFSIQSARLISAHVTGGTPTGDKRGLEADLALSVHSATALVGP